MTCSKIRTDVLREGRALLNSLRVPESVFPLQKKIQEKSLNAIFIEKGNKACPMGTSWFPFDIFNVQEPVPKNWGSLFFIHDYPAGSLLTTTGNMSSVTGCKVICVNLEKLDTFEQDTLSLKYFIILMNRIFYYFYFSIPMESGKVCEGYVHT